MQHLNICDVTNRSISNAGLPIWWWAALVILDVLPRIHMDRQARQAVAVAAVVNATATIGLAYEWRFVAISPPQAKYPAPSTQLSACPGLCHALIDLRSDSIIDT